MTESINVEHWNYLGRRDVKYAKENLFRCHFVHHKSNVNHTEIETGPLQ
jgi:hypothetical protein